MSPRTIGRVAVLLAAAWCRARDANACALPATGHDVTAHLFLTCLHAPRPARKACEREYIAYAGTLASAHKRSNP